MSKGKVKTLAIKLLSTAGTGFFYVTTKNPRNVPRKLSLKKVTFLMIFWSLLMFIFLQYDPIVKQHVVFNEAKMK